ncbi:MAG TPA: hypothetical protein VI653_10405, partial [Steroidobacteraceae bacterium]
MTTCRKQNGLGWVALTSILAIAMVGQAVGQHPGGAHGSGEVHANPGATAGGPHQHFDGRFSHNRYYYD